MAALFALFEATGTAGLDSVVPKSRRRSKPQILQLLQVMRSCQCVAGTCKCMQDEVTGSFESDQQFLSGTRGYAELATLMSWRPFFGCFLAPTFGHYGEQLEGPSSEAMLHFLHCSACGLPNGAWKVA